MSKILQVVNAIQDGSFPSACAVRGVEWRRGSNQWSGNAGRSGNGGRRRFHAPCVPPRAIAFHAPLRSTRHCVPAQTLRSSCINCWWYFMAILSILHLDQTPAAITSRFVPSADRVSRIPHGAGIEHPSIQSPVGPSRPKSTGVWSGCQVPPADGFLECVTHQQLMHEDRI